MSGWGKQTSSDEYRFECWFSSTEMKNEFENPGSRYRVACGWRRADDRCSEWRWPLLSFRLRKLTFHETLWKSV